MSSNNCTAEAQRALRNEVRFYDKPKTLIYEKHTGAYGPNGWENAPCKNQVIGETDLMFVTKVWIEPCWKWIGSKEIEYQKAEYYGIHKSRAIGFENEQLNLFQ